MEEGTARRRASRRASPGGAPSAAPLRLADLERGQQRRVLVRSGVLTLLAVAGIIGVYYILPFDHLTGGRSVLRLSAVVALIVAVFVWQIRRISVAEFPELRAAEALGIVIAVFLVGFSIVYLSMSHGNFRTFSQPLDHTEALYFTVSVFSTVGFGDITPKTDTARLVVSAQMLLDLAIIGVVVRMIFTAARSRIAPGASGGRDSGPAPAG